MATAAEVKALVAVPADTLTDVDISNVAKTETNVKRAAAALCRRLASFYASSTDVEAGSAMVKSSQAYRQWMSMARDFEARAQYSTAGPPVVNGAGGDLTQFPPGQFDNNRG